MQTQIGEPITEKWYAHVNRHGIGMVSSEADYLYDHEGFSKKEIYPIEVRIIGPALCHDNCDECEGCWSR
jgi:hypothetical protein